MLAHWPKDRYLELAPRYWATTRERLDAKQLADEFGPLTEPSPIATPTEEQRATNATD